MSCNSVFLLGPTAVGKTAVGVRLAALFGGEIISADSRQVYVGLDIGSGKDISEYTLADGREIPRHLIDVCTLGREFSLFDFQEMFRSSFGEILSRGRLPLVVGGTGMYLDSILRRYDIPPLPDSPQVRSWREELSPLGYDELKAVLVSEKSRLHNTSEFGDRDRMIKAILLNRFLATDECARIRAERARLPRVEPLVLGTTLDRPLVRERIARRLRERMDSGLVEEVERLHAGGADWARLESLGLEYRFVSLFLQGKIGSRGELFTLLCNAIRQFAKRQETWFRGMERKGVEIRWLPRTEDVGERVSAAAEIISSELSAPAPSVGPGA